MCLFLIPGLLPPPRAPTRHEHVGSLSWPPSSGRIGTLVHVPSLHVSWLHVSWLPASLFCAWGRCSGWNRVLYVLAGTQPLSHTPSLLLHSLIVSEQPIGWVNRRFIYPTSWCLTFVGGVYVKQVVWTKDSVLSCIVFWMYASYQIHLIFHQEVWGPDTWTILPKCTQWVVEMGPKPVSSV